MKLFTRWHNPLQNNNNEWIPYLVMIFNAFLTIQEAQVPPGNKLSPDNQKISVPSL